MKKALITVLTMFIAAETVFGNAVPTFAESNSTSEISASSICKENQLSAENPMEEVEDEPVQGWKQKRQGKVSLKGGSADNSVTMKASSNSCGVNVTWSLSEGTLTITGKGAMKDYSQSERPGWENWKSSITSVVIDSGVTSIGEMAFYDCYNMETVSIPSTVSSIGRIAFAECSSLTRVTVPSAVKVLSYAVFADCTSLKQITCSGVTEIEDYAFQSVPLTTFTVPQNLKTISGLAFFKAKVEAYQVDSGNQVFSAEDGVLYSDGGKTLYAYPPGKTADSFTVPSCVTKIGKAGMAYAKISTVEFGSSVKILDESAFQGAELTSVVMPDSLSKVGNFTFYGCPYLTSVTFGNGLKETSYQMFRECSNLKDINFGNKLQSLDAHTFAYCTSLISVKLPSTIKEIGNGCFGECYELTTFESKALKYVPYSSFWNCHKLKNVVLNQGVTDIYRSAFYGCDSLASVTLPKSVKYIHSTAFPKQTAITCKNSNMEKFGQNGYRYLQKVSITGTRDYKMAYEVLTLVNKERAKKGLGALTMNKSLLESAMKRAAETAVCFSHTRPDGSICFDLNSAMCAENIAAGQSTAKSVMNSWMNSPGHKSNILLTNAGKIGIGCFVHNGVTYWVQCFGVKKDSKNCVRPANRNKTQKISLATEKFSEAENSTGVVVSSGDESEYAYKFKVQLKKNTIKMKETTKARLYVQNPGFPFASALLNNSGITWKTSKKSVAKVDTSGKITGVKKGTVTITGTLKHFKASKKLTVKLDGATK